VKGSKRVASEVPDPPQPEPADSGAGPVTVRSFNRLRDDVDPGEARSRPPPGGHAGGQPHSAAEKAQNFGKKEEAVEEEAAAPTQEELLAEIRDLLANK